MKRYHLSKDLKEVKEPAVQLLGRGKGPVGAAYPTRGSISNQKSTRRWAAGKGGMGRVRDLVGAWRPS